MTHVLLKSMIVGLGLFVTMPCFAEDGAPLPAAPKPSKSKHVHHAKADRTKAQEAKSQQGKAPETPAWAAIDPGRATGMTPPAADPNAAAVPNVQHVVQPDQDRMSYGVKWSSTTASGGGQYGTQGVVNTLNRNLGNQNDLGGTDAEAGMKFHF